MRKSQRTFCLAQQLRQLASNYVSLWKRHEKRMTYDTHLPQSAVCCQLIRERCKTASCLSSYLISRVCDFWKTLDTVCVSFRKDSIGVVQQHSVAISPADEALICVSVMLGMESPWAHACHLCFLQAFTFASEVNTGILHIVSQFKRVMALAARKSSIVEHRSKNRQGL